MKSLIDKLNYYTQKYDEGHPEISDKEWDDLYFELKKKEEETGIIYPNSPTQKIIFNKVSKLNKVKHNHPMLSLDKTKSEEDVESFVKGHSWIAMAKMDGLTCSLRYLDGKLVSAETRGNGVEGEDITHNARIIASIPQQINYKGEIIVDGEIICTYRDFEPFKEIYKNPRNFASGSIRLLDAEECAKRNLTFVAWDVISTISAIKESESLGKKLKFIEDLGFTIVPYFIDVESDVHYAIEEIPNRAAAGSYPIDGVVFKYDFVDEYNSAGRTEHHFKGGLAFKMYDETYLTYLKNIEWTMGRTGVLTPVAIFDPIDIDGSIVERASLHNVSIMKEVLGECAYVGEPLRVYKANQIIPQIAEAGPKYDYSSVIANGKTPANDSIEKCPICGGEVYFATSSEGVVCAYCDNPQCEGKLINRLEHFCGKKGLDIKGISKATFEKLIDWEWITEVEDVFKLSSHREEWIKKQGFGVASVDKILNSIEEHKKTNLASFISAIGIPLIGQTASKDLAKEFKTYTAFRAAVDDFTYDFYTLPNFGDEMNYSLKEFDYREADRISEFLTLESPIVNNNQINNTLENKVICITGKLVNFKNRTELKAAIESRGGKVTDSISSKTDMLINNDVNSTSAKNKAAKDRGIPIITELDFIQQYIEN